MGTRYEIGDTVRILDTGETLEVVDIYDPHSDSPDYMLEGKDTHFNASQLKKIVDTIEAPDNSLWVREDHKHPDNVEAAWKNSRTGHTVIIRNEGETTKKEKVPESQWVGTGGATRRTSTEQEIKAEYPDGTFDQNSVEDAIRDAKMWMKKYPDEDGQFGVL